MSSKFLHAFADDKPELQRQIGCMAGIFQMLDRHHLLASRRANQKRLPSGRPPINNSSRAAEHNRYHPQIVLEKSFSRSSHENQRVSMESSRTSLSSSSCSSSFSSLECNKSTRHEPPSIDRTIFHEKSITNSPHRKSLDTNLKPNHTEIFNNTPKSSMQYGRHSLDFRDVVKDSIYRETCSLSVKTSNKEEVVNLKVRLRDSPRPTPLSKSMTGFDVNGIDGRPKLSTDLNESLKGLVKPKGLPRYISESGESPRPSSEAKDLSSSYTISRENPRFSYDGRDMSRTSLDSKIGSKLRELPRLSLDSRSSNLDLKQVSLLKDLERASPILNLQQEERSHRRLSGVVAKLMGLDPMPNTSLVSREPITTSTDKAYKEFGSVDIPKSNVILSNLSTESEQNQQQYSVGASVKDPRQERLKNQEMVIRPVASSKIPVEAAPWRQQDRVPVRQKAAASRNRGDHFKQQDESVFSEIEKRLNEREFQHSNKDLRALKQILEAMQAKRLPENEKGQDKQSQVQIVSNAPDEGDLCENNESVKGKAYFDPFQSPIVIMKPAKSIKKPSASEYAVIPLKSLSVPQKVNIENSSNRKKNPNNISIKDRTPKANTRESTNLSSLSIEKKSYNKIDHSNSPKAGLPLTQGSPRPQTIQRAISSGSVKTISSVSPRLQHKKIEAQKTSRPNSPDSSKPQRQSNSRQQTESISPRNMLRKKRTQLQENSERLKETGNTSQPEEISVRSDSSISLGLKLDGEVSSVVRSVEMLLQEGNRTPITRFATNATSNLQQESMLSLQKDVMTVEHASTVEQPSPVSILDAPFYQDNLQSSATSKITDEFKDKKIQNLENCRSPAATHGDRLKYSSAISYKKLERIESLVNKLRQLSPADDETTAIDHIASLCESHNPDHRYVSEILLASGLLMKDFSAAPSGSIPIHIHPSGHPINPDLFLVLEQTKSGRLHKLELMHAPKTKADAGKLHRKLVFDLVNEILVQQLESTSSDPRRTTPCLRAKMTITKFPSGQQLLQELCSHIDQLKSNNFEGMDFDEDDSVLDEAVLRCSKGWDDFRTEIPTLVLEMERMIFKDLIAEVLSGVTASKPRAKPNRSRQRLFAN